MAQLLSLALDQYMVLCYSGCFLEAILGVIWDDFVDANWDVNWDVNWDDNCDAN